MWSLLRARHGQAVDMRSCCDMSLDDCISKISSEYMDRWSFGFRHASLSYKRTVKSLIGKSTVKGNEWFEIEMIISSLGKYVTNPELYFLLLYLFTQTDETCGLISAKVLSNELRALGNFRTKAGASLRCDKWIMWKDFGKVLVWMSQRLGAEMAVFTKTLTEIRIDGDDVELISMLFRVLMLLRRFPSCFIDFDPVCQLIRRSLGHDKQEIRAAAGKVLVGVISLCSTEATVKRKVLLKKLSVLFTDMTSPLPMLAIVEVSGLVDRYPALGGLLNFRNSNVMSVPSLENLCRWALVRKCNVDTEANQLEAAVELLSNEVLNRKRKSPEFQQALLILTDLAFTLLDSPGLKKLCRYVRAKGKFVPELGVNETEECARMAACVYTDTLSTKGVRISDDICRALIRYQKACPSSWPVIERDVIGSINSMIFGSKGTDVEKGFRYLEMLNMSGGWLTLDMALTYSVFLGHEMPRVRYRCAKFLAKNQERVYEMSRRLLTYVSTEVCERTREKVIQRICVHSEATELIGSLEPLTYDTQTSVRYCAIRYLCGIRTATNVVLEFLIDVTDRFLETKDNDCYLEILDIVAEMRPDMMKFKADIVMDKLAANSAQNDVSLSLMSRLIPLLSNDNHVGCVMEHVLKCTNVLSSAKRMATGIDIGVALINRFGMNDRIEDFFGCLVKLTEEITDALLQAKIAEALTLIGPVETLLCRNRTVNIPINDTCSVENKLLSFGFSLLFVILRDELKKGAHAEAMKALRRLVKMDLPDALAEMVIDYLDRLLTNSVVSQSVMVLDLVRSIAAFFGERSRRIVPKVIDLVSRSWGSVDANILLRTIMWLIREAPESARDYLPRIASEMACWLSIADEETGMTILFACEAFGKDVALVDHMVIPMLLEWLENMADDTENASMILGILRSVTENARMEVYGTSVIRSLIFVVQKNRDVRTGAVAVIRALAEVLGHRMVRYLPEILPVFFANSEVEYRTVLMPLCQGEGGAMNGRKLSDQAKCQVHSGYTAYTPLGSDNCPKLGGCLSAEQWTEWMDDLVVAVLRGSRSRVCRIFEPMASENLVRMYVFPIALTMLWSESNILHGMFCRTITEIRNPPPYHVMRLMLEVIEHLEVYPGVGELPFSYIDVVRVAENVGNLELALRCAEYEYERVPGSCVKDLHRLYNKLNAHASAEAIAAMHGLEEIDNGTVVSDVTAGKEWRVMIQNVHTHDFDTLGLEIWRSYCHSKFFPSLRSDYARVFCVFCDASILYRLKMIHRYKEMLVVSEKDADVEMQRAAEDKRLHVLCICKDHFWRLKQSRTAGYNSLVICEQISVGEELKKCYIEYMKEHAKYCRSDSNVAAIMNKVEKTNPDRLLVECSISSDRIASLSSLVKTCDPTEAHFCEWNRKLGKWRMKKSDWQAAYENLKCAASAKHKDSEVFGMWSDVSATLGRHQESMDLAFTGLRLSREPVQFALRLISIVFNHGDVAMCERFILKLKSANGEAFMMILPHLVAGLGDERRAVIAVRILVILSRKNPQSVLYSLMFPLRSPNEGTRVRAKNILDKIQSKNATLVTQIMMFLEQMIRVAQTWEEMWFSAIADSVHTETPEDAYRFVATMKSLLEKVEKKPTTVSEVAFLSAFGDRIYLARDRLESFSRTKSEGDFSRAMTYIVDLFRTMQARIGERTSVCLDDVSPVLLGIRDIQLAVPGQYTPLVSIHMISKTLPVFRSKRRPRKMTIIGSDGDQYDFVLKANEDTRLDERIMVLFGFVSTFIKVRITTYKVIPLGTDVGLLGYVRNSTTLSDLVSQHRRLHGRPLDSEIREFNKVIAEEESSSISAEGFARVLAVGKGDDLRKVLLRISVDSNDWFTKRVRYTETLAVTSMIGYIVGIGDRHLRNVMMDIDAKIVHIDFGDCFDIALRRELFPEHVPFRLTRLLVKALEVVGPRGSFASVGSSVIGMMRRNKESILNLLEVFVQDPLDDVGQTGREILDTIEKKLHAGGVTPAQQVADLIEQATSVANLSQMYVGWNPCL